MIERCAVIISSWIIRSEARKESERELYEYAVYSILLSLSPIVFTLTIGTIFGCVGRSICIMLPFTIIRKFSGGYHAKRATTCLFSSTLVLILCIILSFYVQCGWTLISLSVGATASLIHFSPIDNDNRLLSKEEKRCYKKSTIVITVLFLVIDILLFVSHMNTCAVCISIGLVLSACLQYPALFKRKNNL